MTGPVRRYVDHKLLETDDPQIYTIAHALKPGTTRVVIRYALDYSTEQLEFRSAVHHPVKRRSVLLSPEDMELHADDLQPGDDSANMDGFAVFIGSEMESGDAISTSQACEQSCGGIERVVSLLPTRPWQAQTSASIDTVV